MPLHLITVETNALAVRRPDRTPCPLIGIGRGWDKDMWVAPVRFGEGDSAADCVGEPGTIRRPGGVVRCDCSETPWSSANNGDPPKGRVFVRVAGVRNEEIGLVGG